jgi:hypothetical protein
MNEAFKKGNEKICKIFERNLPVEDPNHMPKDLLFQMSDEGYSFPLVFINLAEVKNKIGWTDE